MNQKNFLLIGHITSDITPDGELVPGGPVTYAGATLALRGHNVQIITKAASNEPHLDIFQKYGIDVLNLSPERSVETTTFTNVYDPLQNRTQYVSAVADPFTKEDISHITELAYGRRSLVLPVANEIPYEIYKPLATSAEMLISAPQGSLRRWNSEGKVFHEPFSKEYIAALKHCHVMTVSDEDMAGFDEKARQDILRHTADTVILTNGRNGAEMYQNHHVTKVSPFRLDREHEERNGYPTGNGDHMTAIIAEGAPSFAKKYINPVAYEAEMYTATARGAFLTALKIMERENVTDGINSIRAPNEVRTWLFNNIHRVKDYADHCDVDVRTFIEGRVEFQEGRLPIS